MTTPTLTRSEQFFYDNAGYSRDVNSGETVEHAKLRCAREMAAAELRALDRGLRFVWEQDDTPCMGCECDSEACACSTGEPHETLCCAVYEEDAELPSAYLCGICSPDRKYQRVIEAELAMEVFAI